MTSDLTRWMEDSSVTPRISEISLYPYIQECLSKFPDVKAVSSVRIDGETDLLARIDETKVVFEVKATDSYVAVLDAVLQATRYTEKLNTQNFVVVAYPLRIRRLPAKPSIIKKTALESPLRALVVTRGFRGRIDHISFRELADRIVESERAYKKNLKPFVAYDAVVEVARNSIEKISEYLRIHHGLEESLAEVAIGRFDLYEAILSDVVDDRHLKREARALFWDIVAYVLVNQLLFYSIVRKISGRSLPELPDVHPLTVPQNLPLEVKDCFALIEEDYSPVFASKSIDVLERARDLRVNQALARLIFTIKRLEPENVDVDLLGRLYHDTIPPTTRKRMGAFYTNPHAAELLATISIAKWDCTVLDPACGSGTLLVSSYKRKRELYEEERNQFSTNMHLRFLADHIYGVDAMLFASHMAATNLLLQMSAAAVEKMNIFSDNSLDLLTKTGPNGRIPDNHFDLAIMNPPFTFWRRLPRDERNRIGETFGTSSMNYWGYFLLAVMPKLRENGIVAAVLPDDFLRGKAAMKVRESFFGTNSYSLKSIVKSKAEVAFSESSKFRDYLVLMQKTQPKASDMVATVLVNKRISDFSSDTIKELAQRLRDPGLKRELSSDDFCIYNSPHTMVKKHLYNLHPIVAFTKPELRDIWMNVFDFLESSEIFATLGDLEKDEKIRVRIYRPGQYRQYSLAPSVIRSKVCEVARNLFATKYRAGGKWLFRVEREEREKVTFSVRKVKAIFSVRRSKLLPSLRTYSSVKSFDISDKSEFIIRDSTQIPEEIRKILAWDERAALYAAKDIEEAYTDLSGNCVLLMKPQIPSPNLFWFCYYSSNPLLSTNDYALRMIGDDQEYPKVLTLFINSILGILQIFALKPEIRGAWSRLDKESVWKHLYVPDPGFIRNAKTRELAKAFAKFSKRESTHLQQRLSEPSSLQTSIDHTILRSFQFQGLTERLPRIYSLLCAELQNLLDVMSHV